MPENQAPTTAASAITQATSVTTLRSNLETAVRNGAQDVPDVIRTVAALDPAIDAQIRGAGNGNVWYPVVVGLVSGAAVHLGFGWDAATCSYIGGVILLAGTAAVHWLASQRAAKAQGK